MGARRGRVPVVIVARGAPPRVAFVVGTLGQGGAEKQLCYMARALRAGGIDARVYALAGGPYEAELRAAGVPLAFIGRRAAPPLRMAALAAALAPFRPHIVQSAHFYTNLYVAAVAPALRAIGIGAVRNDAIFDVRENGRWGPWLLKLPAALFVNSHAARRNAERMGIAPRALHVVPNVIDLDAFDHAARAARPPRADGIVVAGIARHVPAKRLDRFLRALALARREVPALRGLLVGEGPEQPALRALAGELGLLPEGARFLGRRDDVPALLAAADIQLLTSDHEGFPNVVLEGMAARLPVVATPAGDAGVVVRHEVTGFIVPFDDVEQMSRRLVALARDEALRRMLGEAGRERAERMYSAASLAGTLLERYTAIAEGRRRRAMARTLSRWHRAVPAR